MFSEIEAKRKRQQSLQGLSKPIISIEHSGYRFVAVRNKLHYSDRWKTFHDFIFAYMGIVLGERIGNEDLAKPRSEQHPISQWHQDCCAYQQKTIKKPGQVQTSEMIGVYAQYMSLAYNLYLMEHNEKLQDAVIERLLDKNRFWGAVYEASVLGSFILAGFHIELEDESDGKSSHVEFTAVHKSSGEKLSVEAKARQPGKDHVNITNQLYKALKKHADHKRVVCIDLNIAEHDTDLSKLDWPSQISNILEEQEAKLMINGNAAPPAYVVITNHLYNTEPHSLSRGSAFFVTGFKTPGFDTDSAVPLEELVRERESHRPIHDLISSMKEHRSIPSTFDDELPEFAYSDAERTFTIGKPIEIILNPDESKSLKGLLEEAIVIEAKQAVTCIVRNETGSHIVELPLTENELSAYRAHPDTFFGIYRKVNHGINTPLDAYDFFHSAYKETSKEKLLEFMKKSSQYETLMGKSQKELAQLYSIRMAEHLLSNNPRFNTSLK